MAQRRAEGITVSSPAGLSAAVGAVTVWGLGNVLAKYIDLSGPALAFDRLWFGAFYSFVLVAVFRRSLSLSGLRRAAPGGVAFGVNIALFFTAVKLTSVTDATIIAALQPAILLLVVGRLFGEKVTLVTVLGGVVAFGGTALVVLAPGGGGRHTVWGDVLAAGAVVAWAWYFVASKRARRTMGTVEYQAAMTLVAAVVLTPVALVHGGRLAGGWGTWGWVVLLATVPGGGHFLMNWAHEHISLAVASLLNLATPVVAMAGAALLLGERVTALQMVGTAVTLVALAAVILDQRGGPLPAEPVSAGMAPAPLED
ncbi:MAG TPA: DMT family transporter [Acidimicrobiales bacterium]|nr:DMT family transporter [Acidimicrobiales bacterium]